MINELYDAHVAIERAGIKAPSWHPKFKSLPQYPTFYLMIDESGGIVDIIPIDEDRKRGLRKWEPDNGKSFPAFNIPRLFQPSSDEKLKTHIDGIKKEYNKSGAVDPEAIQKLLSLIPERFERTWNHNTVNTLTTCIRKQPHKLYKTIGDPPPDFESFKKLIDRTLLIDPDCLFDKFVSLAREKMLKDPNDAVSWMDNLLFGTNKISMVLELAERGRIPYPANHPKVLEWVNGKLLEELMRQQAESKADILDALGEPYTGTDPKFPEMNLPVLGNVKLRSMFKDIPCQFRYGRAEADSFPLNVPARQKLKESMEWLTDPERKGLTWKTVSTATDYTAAILVAYPSELPEYPPQLAAMLGGPEKDGSPDKLRFEDLSSQVIEALDSIVKGHPQTRVHVFVLAKADKARSKLVTRAEFSAHRLIESAERWQAGGQNLPEFCKKIRSGRALVEFSPLTPFPTEVVSILKTTWIRGGETSVTVKGVRIADGIALLVGSGREERDAVVQVLRLAVDRAGPLLVRLGHAGHREDKNFKITKTAVEYGGKVLGMIGLLLYKLNHMKGDYMHGAPFLVGRVLKLSDLIHREYCIHVRDNHLPPQLVGNALIPAALDNPQAGLARLFERLRVYQAWASTTQGENIGLAKWSLKQLELTSEELSWLELPTRCDDEAKAQMMLGYLSRIPSDKDVTDIEVKEGE